jgi:hypothetical protein
VATFLRRHEKWVSWRWNSLGTITNSLWVMKLNVYGTTEWNFHWEWVFHPCFIFILRSWKQHDETFRLALHDHKVIFIAIESVNIPKYIGLSVPSLSLFCMNLEDDHYWYKYVLCLFVFLGTHKWDHALQWGPSHYQLMYFGDEENGPRLSDELATEK